MLAPHVAAVWMAYKRRSVLEAGALAGVAFWAQPPRRYSWPRRGVLWHPAGAPLMAAGSRRWRRRGGVAVGRRRAGRRTGREVGKWGRLYAGGTFVPRPWRNGFARTLETGWGFHGRGGGGGRMVSSSRPCARRSARGLALGRMAGIGPDRGGRRMRFFRDTTSLLLPVWR